MFVLSFCFFFFVNFSKAKNWASTRPKVGRKNRAFFARACA